MHLDELEDSLSQFSLGRVIGAGGHVGSTTGVGNATTNSSESLKCGERSMSLFIFSTFLRFDLIFEGTSGAAYPGCAFRRYEV